MCKHGIKTRVIQHSFGPYMPEEKKRFKYVFVEPLFLGANLHKHLGVGGCLVAQNHRSTVPVHCSILSMEQAAEEVVETEQAAEEVVATAAAGAKVADLLASEGVTISPAILSLGANVVLQQYSLLSIDGFPDFSEHLSIFPLSA